MKTCAACETQMSGVALSLLKVNALSRTAIPHVSVSDRFKHVEFPNVAGPVKSLSLGGAALRESAATTKPGMVKTGVLTRAPALRAGGTRRSVKQNKTNQIRDQLEKKLFEDMMAQAVAEETVTAAPLPFASTGGVAERIRTQEGMVKELTSRLPEGSIVRVKTHRATNKKFVIFRVGHESAKFITYERVAQFLVIDEFLKTQQFPSTAQSDNYKRFWESLFKQNVSAVELSKHSALKRVSEGVMDVFKAAFGDDFTFVMDDKKPILNTSALRYGNGQAAVADGQAQAEELAGRSEIILLDDSIARMLKYVTELKDDMREAVGSDKDFMAHFPGMKARSSRRHKKANTFAQQHSDLVDLAADCRNLLSSEDVEKLESKIDDVYDDSKRQNIRYAVSTYMQALTQYLSVQKKLGLPESLIPESQYFSAIKNNNPLALQLLAPAPVANSNALPGLGQQNTKTWDAAMRLFALTNRLEFNQSANYVKGASQRLLTALASAQILCNLYKFKLPPAADLAARAEEDNLNVQQAAARHDIQREEVRQLHDRLQAALVNFRKNDFLMDVVHEALDSSF